MNEGPQTPELREPESTRAVEGAEADEIDLRDLLGVLLAGKWWILAITLLSLAIGVGYALTATPVYRATALLQVEKKTPSLTGTDSLESLMGKEPEAATEIQILKSRSVLGKTVDKRNLTIQAEPVRFPVIGGFLARRADTSDGPVAPWFGLASYAWGGETLAVKRLTVAPRLKGETLTLVAGQGNRYRVLDPEGKPLLTGRVGAVARSQATDRNGEPLVALFVSTLKARPETRFAITKRSRLQAIQGLQQRLGASEQGEGTGIIQLSLEGADRARLPKILDTMANTFLRQNVERRSAQAEESLKFLEQQLPKMQTELETAEERLSDFREAHQTLDLKVQTEKLLEQLVQIDSRLSELQAKKAEASKNFGPKHPKMQALEAQIAQLREEKAQLESQVTELPETQKQVLSLRRQVEVNTEVYTSMLNKAEELRVAKAGTVGNVRVVDYAAEPEEPVAPNKKLVTALSGVLGGFLGVFFVFLRRFFQQGLEDPDELETRLGLPVYAVVPHVPDLERLKRRRRRKGELLPILALERPQEPVTESFRSYRTGLQFGLLEASNNQVLITGASPGAGKSFVLVNTAVVLGQGGQRTLLVDADMRRGHLHEYLGGERAPGLSEVLSGASSPAAAIRGTQQENLDFLATGTLPPNPAELLMSEAFARFQEQVQAEYDLVLLDGPPVMVVTDSTILAAYAGATFLVVRAADNTLEEMAETTKRLRRNKGQVSGVIFNDFGHRTSYYTAGKYSHGYYYQYSYRSANA